MNADEQLHCSFVALEIQWCARSWFWFWLITLGLEIFEDREAQNRFVSG